MRPARVIPPINCVHGKTEDEHCFVCCKEAPCDKCCKSFYSTKLRIENIMAENEKYWLEQRNKRFDFKC